MGLFFSHNGFQFGFSFFVCPVIRIRFVGLCEDQTTDADDGTIYNNMTLGRRSQILQFKRFFVREHKRLFSSVQINDILVLALLLNRTLHADSGQNCASFVHKSHIVQQIGSTFIDVDPNLATYLQTAAQFSF